MNSKLLIVMYSELNYITLGNAYQLNENMAHPLNLPSWSAIVILNLSFSTLKDLFKLIFLIFKPSFWFQFLAWQWKRTLQGRFYCHQKRCVNNMLIIAWLSRYNSIKRADKHDCMQTLKSHLNTTTVACACADLRALILTYYMYCINMIRCFVWL